MPCDYGWFQKEEGSMDLERSRRRRTQKDAIHVRGFFRVHLVERDQHGMPQIVGDSGWQHNMVVMVGKQQYLAMALGASAGSKQISRIALGTGVEPATNATALPGELAHMTGASSTRNRATVAVATGSSGSTVSVQFAATWASSVQFVTTTVNIANIAVLNNTDNAGTIFAGNTFALTPMPMAA
jgi:hypothetical protein